MLVVFIAAKFNHSAMSGWPMIQIKKNDSQLQEMNRMEPRQSGYLNVFMYELMIAIQVGDRIRIGLPWSASSNNISWGSKYLLAFLHCPGIHLEQRMKAMVHVEVKNVSSNDQAATTSKAMRPSSEHSESTSQPFSSDNQGGGVTVTMNADESISTFITNNTDAAGKGKPNSITTPIIISVFCVLVIAVVFSSVIIVFITCKYHRKKRSEHYSPNTTNMSVNTRSSVQENTYMDAQDRMGTGPPVALGGIQSGGAVQPPPNDQQDVSSYGLDFRVDNEHTLYTNMQCCHWLNLDYYVGTLTKTVVLV